tara:strand:- start:16984 stop:17127 length:144 start_codon:yes stop_codon:yes gene_type:complete
MKASEKRKGIKNIAINKTTGLSEKKPTEKKSFMVGVKQRMTKIIELK